MLCPKCQTPAKGMTTADFVARHLPASAPYRIVQNLSELEKAAREANAPRWLIVSDGHFHALFERKPEEETLSFEGIGALQAHFERVGYVFVQAFHKEKQDWVKSIDQAMHFAQKAHLPLYFPYQAELTLDQVLDEAYPLQSPLVVPDGLHLEGNGTILRLGERLRTLPEGEPYAFVSMATGAQNIVINGFVFDMSQQNKPTLIVQGSHIRISNNAFYNGKAQAILLQADSGLKRPSQNIHILGNRIALPPGESAKDKGAPAISVRGEPNVLCLGDDWQTTLCEEVHRDLNESPGEAYDGNFIEWYLYAKAEGYTRAVAPNLELSQIYIRNNHIDGGRYGIEMSRVGLLKRQNDASLTPPYEAEISQNYITRNTRNISLQNSCHHILIENNLLNDAKSTSILLGYRSQYNQIKNNRLVTMDFIGHAPIQLQHGSSHNLIEGNQIEALNPQQPPGQWLFYIGSDSSHNRVSQNLLSGDLTKSAFAVEALWDYAGNRGEVYSYASSLQPWKPNYCNPYSGGNGSTENIDFSHNILALHQPDSLVAYFGAHRSKGWNRKSCLGKVGPKEYFTKALCQNFIPHDSCQGSFIFPERDIIGHIQNLNTLDNHILGKQNLSFVRELELDDAWVNGKGNDVAGFEGHEEGSLKLDKALYSRVDAALTEDLEALYLMGTQEGLKGRGNAKDNLLVGSLHGDELWAGEGQDRLDGGAGHDRLEGGLGADVFIFDSPLGPNAISNNIDELVDFNAFEGDLLYFSERSFGTLAGAWFAPNREALTHETRIFYEKGLLYFDADGSGPAFSAHVLARFSGELSCPPFAQP